MPVAENAAGGSLTVRVLETVGSEENDIPTQLMVLIEAFCQLAGQKNIPQPMAADLAAGAISTYPGWGRPIGVGALR